MKRVLIFLIFICINAYSQKFESRFFGGVTLPIGAEVGFIGETDLPKIEILKVLAKAYLYWAPVSGNKEDINSVLIAGFQPGLRLKLINDIVLISGGLSINPIMPLPFDGMDLGLGTFLGIGVRIHKVEIGLYTTNMFGREMGWLSLTISRAFLKKKESTQLSRLP